MTDKITTYPSAILRKKAEKVKFPLSKENKSLISRLVKVMRANKGLGLSATQINHPLQIFVVEDLEVFAMKKTGHQDYCVFINPKITACSRKKVAAEEGCLSFPGKSFSIKRHETVKVRYFDNLGKKQKIKATGLLARVLQHEIDHLNGVLVIDCLKTNQQ